MRASRRRRLGLVLGVDGAGGAGARWRQRQRARPSDHVKTKRAPLTFGFGAWRHKAAVQGCIRVNGGCRRGIGEMHGMGGGQEKEVSGRGSHCCRLTSSRRAMLPGGWPSTHRTRRGCRQADHASVGRGQACGEGGQGACEGDRTVAGRAEQMGARWIYVSTAWRWWECVPCPPG